MSALKCVLLLPGQCNVISKGFIRNMAVFRIVWYMLTIFVGGGFLKRPSINAKFVVSEGQKNVSFSQV